jgi:5-hydroxyisourate hydrolase-like protein (transthyretin family)
MSVYNRSLDTNNMTKNNMSNRSSGIRNIISSHTLTGFSVLLLLILSFLSLSSIQISNNVIAAVDIDTSGDGRAAAYDGKEGIATDGDSFCSITNDIAGGKFSSLFEGIVGDCDNHGSSQSLNQFLVEYSYTQNPVKIGEKTYLTITVKDKDTGNPISDASVTLAIDDTPSSLRDSVAGTAFAAAAAGVFSDRGATATTIDHDKITQTMHTDSNGRATFTVQLGPKSDTGTYDTDIEVSKDSYQSGFEQTDLRVT